MSEVPTGRRRYGMGFWFALVLATYPLVYFALVQRVVDAVTTTGGPTRIHYGAYYVSNQTVNLVLTVAFKPAHTIDRTIRHKYWTFSDKP